MRFGVLSVLGRREEALAAIEQAVIINRQLAADQPAAFLPDLATSLYNQFGWLAALGRLEAALAAIEQTVTIRRQLARDRPRVFASTLADSLNYLAAVLSALGRDAEAAAARDEAAAAMSVLDASAGSIQDSDRRPARLLTGEAVLLLFLSSS